MIGKEKKVKINLLAPDKQTIDAEDEAVVRGQFMKIQQNEQKYWLKANTWCSTQLKNFELLKILGNL